MEIQRVSASQTKDFLACERIWANKNILREYPPKTEALEKGSAIHGGLEAYLKSGAVAPEIVELAKNVGLTPEDLAEFVAAIKPFYGEPGEGVTEHRAVMGTWEGGPDFVLVVDHAREVQHPEHGLIPQIDDLKTTSDFRYCKTPDELAHDVQMISYAKWALTLFEEQSMPPPNFVALRHVYVRTKGKKVSRESSTLVTPAHVEEQWQGVLGTVRRMVEVARTFTDIQAVTPNTDNCSAYGGCFYRSKCFGDVSIGELFKQEKKKMSGTNGTGTSNVVSGNFPGAPARMSMADRLKQKLGGAAAVVKQPGQEAPQVPPAGPIATEAPSVQVVPPGVAGTQRIVCGSPCSLSPALTCTLIPHTGKHESRNDKGGVMHWDTGTMALGPSPDWKPLDPAVPAPPHVLPPDAPSRMSTPEEVAAANAPKRGRPKKAVVPAPVAPQPSGIRPLFPDSKMFPPTSEVPAVSQVVGPTTQAAPPSQDVSEAPPASPGRVSRLRRHQEATAAAPGAPAAAPAADVVSTSPSAQPVCRLEELYIDSYPMRGAVEAAGLAEDILGPASALAAETGEVADYRLISYTSRGVLATAIRSMLDKVPRVLVVSSSMPGADVLLEVLVPHARRVTRAMRG